ncbi:MAG TPA: hypothetical protein VF970_13435, partial [Gemmatimonadales bacterium]
MKTTRTLATLFSLLAAGTAAAQTGPERVDSLEREVQTLRARIDSLEILVQRLARQGQDTVAAVDELAALRAAARTATGASDSAPPPAGQPQVFIDRARSLSQLNPEISATADVRLGATREAPLENNVEVREVEVSFQSALDPYSSTKIFVGLREGEVEVEEAYAYWTGLPGKLRLDLGRFRQQVGELNRWHPHALPESESPLVLREFLG